MKNKITNQALDIIKQYPIYEELPASISGKHHFGETLRQHSELSVKIMKELCREFNVSEEDTDMLVATMYLHDIGNCVISFKGEARLAGYTCYQATNFSRLNILHRLHPLISAQVIKKHKIDRKEEIKRLVSIHMSHWYKSTCPQPENLFEYLVCIADYMATHYGMFECPKCQSKMKVKEDE